MNKKEVYYRSRSLFKALRASIAIPTVFTPVIEGRSQLVDGGVLNPLPLNLIKLEAGEIAVAVNLNANNCMKNDSVLEEIKEKAAYQKMLDAFRSQILKLDSKGEVKIEAFGFFDLLTKSLDMIQERVAELTIALYKPDIVVNISRDSCGVFEFYRASEMIEEGRKAFQKSFQHFLASGSRDKIPNLPPGPEPLREL